MIRVEDMLDEMASAAAPPSRLAASDLYASGRRRRRRRRAAGGVAVVAGVAAIAVWITTFVAPGGTYGPEAGASPSGSVTGPAGRIGGIYWAVAADRNHLYATVEVCDSAGQCSGRLQGSDDGGRTWTVRSTEVLPYDTRMTDAKTLFTWKIPGKEAVLGLMPETYAVMRPLMSTDGGRTWSELTKSATPVPSVPAGGIVECFSGDPGPNQLCRAYVVDIATRRVAPLAHQPDLGSGGLRREIPGLWYSGSEPSGMSHRPAVAHSVDAGRSWSTHVFDCECTEPDLFSNDGTTVYAAMSLKGSGKDSLFSVEPDLWPWDDLRMFRSVDGGATWQPFALPHPPVQMGYLRPILQLLADGTFAAADHGADQAGPPWWVLRTGRWERVTISGRPAAGFDPGRTDDGGYLSLDYDGVAWNLYRSADWFTWTRVLTVA